MKKYNWKKYIKLKKKRCFKIMKKIKVIKMFINKIKDIK